MQDIDHFASVQGETRATIKVDRSVFTAIAFDVLEENQFNDRLAQIRRQHFDATHHCWAYRLFASFRSRSSDDGEPSGTAGKPILGAIESSELYDVGLVVVRWYGGVKLGTGGLARAYRDAARAVIESASRRDCFVYQRIAVEVPFSALNEVYRIVSPPDIVLVDEQYGEVNVFTFDVRLTRVETFTKALEQLRLSFRMVESS